MPKRIKTFSNDIPQKKIFTSGAVETVTYLNQITSMKLFHELMHHSRYRKDDIPHPTPTTNEAYGWQKCVKKSEADARNNADNWSLLGVTAQCMQRQFWVDPSDPSSGKLFKNDKLEAIKLTKRGALVDWLPSFSQMKRVAVSARDVFV
jgi:hypothetical protein